MTANLSSPSGSYLLMLRVLASLLAAAFAMAAASAADGARYRVVGATASSRLTFATPTGGAMFLRGSVNASFARRGSAAARGDGSVSSRGGRVLFPVRGQTVERVVTGERPDATSPYVESSCGDRRFPGGRGGLVFRSISRGRLEARWAFPHALTRLCPGPRFVPPARRMIAVVPATRLSARRFRVVLSGTARFRSFGAQRFSGTYRWRAVVTLQRV